MMTVHEVSKISGVSIRALHHYDKIGLLPATEVTSAGYRLYDDTALERLQHILLFKELEFSLKEIKDILDSPDFDRDKALEQQIYLLELRKEHIENLIDLARGIKMIGVKDMSFEAFDTRKIDEYAEQAKASWGKTDAYKEYEQKASKRSMEEQQSINARLMGILLNLEKSEIRIRKVRKQLNLLRNCRILLQNIFINVQMRFCWDLVLCTQAAGSLQLILTKSGEKEQQCLQKR